MLTTRCILMNADSSSFPREWPVLLPGVEYLYFTAPQMPLGFSAKDMCMGYYLTQSRAKDNWGELYPQFRRVLQKPDFGMSFA